MQHNQIVYNRIAQHFSATRSWVWDDLAPLKQYVKDGDKVLDLACGNGRLYQLFSSLSSSERIKNAELRMQNIDYVGLDNSVELIKIAREKYPSIRFVVGDMRNLPFADSSFNVIFCLAAFHHLPDTEIRSQALKEMRRVLKPGGRLIMTNWNLYSDWAKEKLEIGKWKLGKDDREIIVPWKNQTGEIVGERVYYGYTQADLKEMFESVGLTVEEQYMAVKKGAKNAGEGQNIVTIARTAESAD